MTDTLQHTFLIYGHRGTSLLAPENTAAAFDLCLAQGADVLEIDVRISRDDRVIVTHDATLERTTDGSGEVLQHSLAQLKRLDAGCRFEANDNAGSGNKVHPARLLTLDELFERYPDTRINVDIKDTFERAAELVADCIGKAGRQNDTTVGSFHRTPMLHFRKLMPSVQSAALKEEVANLYFRYRLGLAPPLSKSTDRDGQKLPYGVLEIPVSYFKIPLARQGFVDHIHSLGLKVCFWTLNEPDAIEAIARLGVDGIVTDRADLASELRASGIS